MVRGIYVTPHDGAHVPPHNGAHVPPHNGAHVPPHNVESHPLSLADADGMRYSGCDARDAIRTRRPSQPNRRPMQDERHQPDHLICQSCGIDLKVAQCGDTCPACGEPIVADDDASD